VQVARLSFSAFRKSLPFVFCYTCLFLVSRAKNLILASNPDPEGEAISWHIKEMLEQQNLQRMLLRKL
jgi:DNA topoisomerase IA